MDDNIIIIIMIFFGVVGFYFFGLLSTSPSDPLEEFNKNKSLESNNIVQLPLTFLIFESFINQCIQLSQDSEEYVLESKVFDQPVRFIFQHKLDKLTLIIPCADNPLQIDDELLSYYYNHPELDSAFNKIALPHLTSENLIIISKFGKNLKILLTKAHLAFVTKKESVFIHADFYDMMLILLKKFLKHEFDFKLIDRTIFNDPTYIIKIKYLRSFLHLENINQNIQALIHIQSESPGILTIFREQFKAHNLESLFDEIITININKISYHFLDFLLGIVLNSNNHYQIINFLNQFNYMTIIHEEIESRLQAKDKSNARLLLDIVRQNDISLPFSLLNSLMQYFIDLNLNTFINGFICRIKLEDINDQDKRLNSRILTGLANTGNIESIHRLKEMLNFPKLHNNELKKEIESCIKVIQEQLRLEKSGALSVVDDDKQGSLTISEEEKMGALSLNSDTQT